MFDNFYVQNSVTLCTIVLYDDFPPAIGPIRRGETFAKYVTLTTKWILSSTIENKLRILQEGRYIYLATFSSSTTKFLSNLLDHVFCGQLTLNRIKGSHRRRRRRIYKAGTTSPDISYRYFNIKILAKQNLNFIVREDW